MKTAIWAVWLAAAMVCCVGCGGDNPFTNAKTKEAADKKKAAERKKMVHKNLIRQQKELEQKAGSTLKVVEQSYRQTQEEIRGASSATGSRTDQYRSDVTASRQVLKQVKESAELEPSAVVWLIDTSASALRVTDELRRAAGDFYTGDTYKVLQAANSEQLLTAVVGFGETTDFTLDPPTGDGAAVKAAFDKLTSNNEGREATFATLKAAVDKYLPLKLEQRRLLMFVLATDEAGDDPEIADQIVPILRKHEIPVFVIGLNAPWGSANPTAAASSAKGASPARYGPESLLPERVLIEASGFRGGGTDLVDSGFGPHGLERVARAGGGSFLAVRPTGGGMIGWPSGTEIRYEAKAMKKYAPDYVSLAEYQKLASENKARGALVAAAKLPITHVLKSPTTSFFKRNEAELKKQLAAAQREAARVSPEIDKIVDLLATGESDRDKLTSPRWQAAFDLAYGRALAAKVRADVYNATLAALNRGKNFEREGSNTWNLEAADTVETDSRYQKMADKARLLLKRVVNEHPGTPWAKEAADELQTPLGWKLSEG